MSVQGPAAESTWSVTRQARPRTEVPVGWSLPERYTDLGPLGSGAQAFVRRAWDGVLDRPVAVKILWPHHAARSDALRRFQREAQVTAGLAHPGIVTIHDFGTLPGRLPLPFQVLTVVSQRTLADHLARRPHAPPGELEIVQIRAMTLLVARAAEAVGFAHRHAVVHRDLKPANIALGDHGEVVVLDWGLACGEPGALHPRHEALVGGALTTQASGLRGTPLYMPPEQARAEPVGPRADVFALGAILYDGFFGVPRSPAGGLTEVVRSACDGELRDRSRLAELPAGLGDLLAQALDLDPQRRPADASCFARSLQAWLSGVENVVRARQCLARADELDAEHRRCSERRSRLQRALDDAASVVPDWAPPHEKQARWDLEDELRVASQHQTTLEVERRDVLLEALTHLPDHREAHRRLAALAREDHAVATAQADSAAALAAEARCRRHDHLGLHRDWLSGNGRLTLTFSRLVQSVCLRRVVRHQRRWVPGPGWSLHPDDLRDLELPAGPWVVEVESTDGVAFDVPVEIARAVHFAGGLQPGEAVPVYVPTAAEVPAGTRYVPAGPYWSGGDPKAYGDAQPGARQWLDGFAIQTTPVTAGAWVAFLNDLVARGRHDDAARWQPQERTAAAKDQGSAVFGRAADGTYFLTHDGDGDLWLASWPIVLIDVDAMEGYAAWRSEDSEWTWQLPWELQWEKAARGVDARVFPWGDHFDPTFCSNSRSKPDGVTVPPSVHDHPFDVSPFGVRCMAGGVTEVCRDTYTPSGPLRGGAWWAPSTEAGRGRVGRGGAYSAAAGKCRVAFRTHIDEDVRAPALGFRLVVPVGPQHSRRS